MKADLKKLDRAFNPKCVVVIGDSRENNFQWLHGQSSFKGKLYSVQLNPESIKSIEAMGIKNYTSLMDVPEEVDLAIVAVSRTVSLRVMDDLIRKNVAAASFYTSGFSETGTEEGIRLEKQLKEKAEAANFHVIGPNCMGVFNPKIGIRQTERQYLDGDGAVGFISQSGGLAIAFAQEAHLQGVDIEKSVSFGNGSVLEAADYLDYFHRDPKIKVIGMYMEGVKDAKRFMNSLKEATSHKPVVVWKGGRTDVGGRAIASHTGSLAVPLAIWDAAVKQCGAINVASMDELIDTLKALMLLPPVRGDRVALVGGGGGVSVSSADEFAETGLKLPPLSSESYKEFSSFFSLVGGYYKNPVDTGNPNREQMKRIMGILARDANIDNLVLIASMNWGDAKQLKSELDSAVGVRKNSLKPVLSVIRYGTPGEMRRARTLGKRYHAKGIPSYPSVVRAARALKNTLEYYRRLDSGD